MERAEMKLYTPILILIITAGAALAQRHKLGTVNAETPEGLLLQQIGQTEDESKKLQLMEQFAAQAPKHEAIGWVYEQMQTAYLKAGQPDKTLEIGDKLVAMDADDLDAAHQNLKAAEAKKDPDLIRKWSNQTSQIAQKVIQSPQPADADEVDAWKKRVDFAKQLDTYTEYSLYSGAMQTQDPRKRIELADALTARNPKSQYLPALAELRFNSYRQLGDNANALAAAEKTLETDQSQEDLLIFVANQYVEKKRDPDKVIAYSAKIVDLMNTKPKPEGVSEDDWAKKKKTMSGLAHYMSGTTLFDQKKLAPADKELRAALPLVEGNDQLKAATLFYAGLANYQMKNIPDALKFNQQCAAIKSPFQAKAAENARVMRQQGAGAKK
jgi:tetratricopeptide (TPR) repeat protein